MKKQYQSLFIFAAIFSLFSACSNSDDYVSIAPIASDDTVNSSITGPVVIPVLANDITGGIPDPSKVSIKNGVDTDGNGTLDQLLVSNQGTWTVNPTTGEVTFTPTPTFTGNPNQISYTVKDIDNTVSNEALVTINAVPIVNVNLTLVPLPKLSDYHFFIGDIKNQIPSLDVLPYEPASSLFTDYAIKKRFIWMPKGVKGTFNGVNNVIELPVGAALIKSFYYDNVQPNNTTRIIETRIMIRKASGWIFAEYVWNEEQTEAYLNMNGSSTSVTWKDENNIIKTASNYRIPSGEQCLICHKVDSDQGSGVVSVAIPIGIKPQNLNFNYNYNSSNENQLYKWVQQNYLENAIPSNIESTVNYKDTSKPLELRVRSYLDINCAHCHQEGSHCSYRPMRFAFSETGNSNGRTNQGVCVDTQDMAGFPESLSKIINPSNVDRSMLYYRLNTEEGYKMPLLGRSIIHEEGVNLIREYINSLSGCR